MENCPMCGHPLARIMTAEQLLGPMRAGLDCYQGQDRNYYLTRGGGRVSRTAINDALAKGLIVPKWDDAPHLEYWRAA